MKNTLKQSICPICQNKSSENTCPKCGFYFYKLMSLIIVLPSKRIEGFGLGTIEKCGKIENGKVFEY